MRVYVFFMCAAFWSALSGCSLISHDSKEVGSSAFFLELQTNPPDIAAGDIVSAIVQTQEFRDIDGPIRLPPDDSPYFKHLVERLRDLGFSVKHVSYSDTNRGHYSATLATPGTEKIYQYSLSLNGVKVTREYEERMTGLFPKTKMMVSGTKSRIRLNDAEFEEQDPSQVFPTGVRYIEGKPLAPMPVIVTSLSQIESSNERGVQGKTLLATEGIKETEPPQEIPIIAYGDLLSKDPNGLQNIYYTDTSNFSDIFDGFSEVERHVIVFANDSKILGPKGKRLARKISKSIDPENEIVSMVGCSHGNTAIQDGNRILAIGRVKRLMQEFTDLGVKEDLVFAEGCWAPVHFDEVFPRRGVVVTILKKNS